MLPTLLRSACASGRTLVKSLVHAPSLAVRSGPALFLPAYARSQHTGQMKDVRVSYIDPNCPFAEKTLKARVYSLTDESGVSTGVAALDRRGFPRGHPAGHHYDHYANSAHTLHGGAQAALHDLAACQALHEMGLSGATEKLRVNYVSSMDLDSVSKIEAHAQVRHADEDEAFVRSQLYCNDIVVSKAAMSFKIWPAKPYEVERSSEASNVGPVEPRDYF